MGSTATDYAAAVDLVYGAAADPGLWPETLAQLCDQFGATGAFLIYHPPDGPGALLHARLRTDLVDPYFTFYARNPFSEAYARLAPGRVYAGSAVADMAALRRSAFYADILAPQAMEEQIVVPVDRLTRGGSSGGVAFTFNRERVEHAHRQMAWIGRLAPHFARAVGLGLDLAAARAGDRLTMALLDAMPAAALLLDGAGALIAANARAERLLDENDGLSVLRADRLRVVAATGGGTRQLDRVVQEAIVAGSAADRGISGDLRLTRPSGRPALLVSAIPLPPGAFLPHEAADSGARVLLQVIDPVEPHRHGADRLAAATGLTAAEARVAALVGAGLSVPAAAAALGLSQNTVKTHLARCYDKTGVRSQAGLARLLAAMAGAQPTGASAG